MPTLHESGMKQTITTQKSISIFEMRTEGKQTAQVSLKEMGKAVNQAIFGLRLYS